MLWDEFDHVWTYWWLRGSTRIRFYVAIAIGPMAARLSSDVDPEPNTKPPFRWFIPTISIHSWRNWGWRICATGLGSQCFQRKACDFTQDPICNVWSFNKGFRLATEAVSRVMTMPKPGKWITEDHSSVWKERSRNIPISYKLQINDDRTWLESFQILNTISGEVVQ